MMQLCPCCGVDLKKYERVVLGNVEVEYGCDVVFEGQRVPMNETNPRLIVEALVRANGRPMTRDALLNIIDCDGDQRAIDVYISRARTAFRKIDPAFDQITCTRYVGYAWVSKPRVSVALKLVA